MIADLAQQAMPLVRSGGVFLMIVGAAILLGAVWEKPRYALLALGGVAGSIALALLAIPLSVPYGPPTMPQLYAIAAAVVFEVLAIALIVPRAARHGQRAMTIAILAIVGAHFLIMTPAFGPLIFALGVANVLNAVSAAFVRTYPMRMLWAVDGVLKIAFGAAMFLAH